MLVNDDSNYDLPGYKAGVVAEYGSDYIGQGLERCSPRGEVTPAPFPSPLIRSS